LKLNLEEKNKIFKALYGFKGFSFNEIYREYLDYGRRIKRYSANTPALLNKAIKLRKHILFEGAQGTLLDIDHGTYPYVTSSNATAGGACTGTGVGPSKIDKVIGIVKAYTTRVGDGPFPTQFEPELLEKVRKKGNEYGATTGRPRRCGWFDAVIARYSVMINGINEIVVTKLDVLDGMDRLKICVGYKYKGRLYRDFPTDMRVAQNCDPVYEKCEGWQEDTSLVKRFEALPAEAKRYIKRIEDLLGAKVTMISIGSERKQMIKRPLSRKAGPGRLPA
jgi:adenylosuccinate synthase